MKYACGIIRDLLPLYLDEVAAAESRAAVEEHIAACAECAQLYRLMQGEAPFEAEREQYMQKQMQEHEQQLQGKKRMSAGDFMRGHRLTPGDRFCALPEEV